METPADTEEGPLADAPPAPQLDERLAARLRLAPLPAGPHAGYLCELDRRPRPADERERELVLAAKAGDQDARGRLIEACLPLIAATARMYRESPRIERLELLQEGVVGLLRALERYDPDRGVPFWAYASWWVRQAMQQLVAELTRPVVLSDRALRQLARIKDAHRSFLQAHGREPSPAEIAASTEFGDDQVVDLIATDRPPRALEEPVAGEEGDAGTLGELLADPVAEADYERVLAESEIEQLRSLLSGLSDRERSILRARYGLDQQELTLREIAAGLGLSAERVRQIEQRALSKLRAAVSAEEPAPG